MLDHRMDKTLQAMNSFISIMNPKSVPCVGAENVQCEQCEHLLFVLYWVFKQNQEVFTLCYTCLLNLQLESPEQSKCWLLNCILNRAKLGFASTVRGRLLPPSSAGNWFSQEFKSISRIAKEQGSVISTVWHMYILNVLLNQISHNSHLFLSQLPQPLLDWPAVPCWGHSRQEARWAQRLCVAPDPCGPRGCTGAVYSQALPPYPGYGHTHTHTWSAVLHNIVFALLTGTHNSSWCVCVCAGRHSLYGLIFASIFGFTECCILRNEPYQCVHAHTW